MNILMLTLAYEINGNSIYRDLVKELEKKGHNVSVITPNERRKNEESKFEYDDKTKILRFKYLNMQKTNILEKGIGTLLIENQFIKNIKKYYSDKKFDLVIYSTPPIMFSKVIEFVKNRDDAKSYLLLKDIFPQNAVDLGMMKKDGIKGILYKNFRKKEKELYEVSDYIGCMSPKNVEYVLKHNKINQDKIIEVCPNSIIPSNEICIDKEKIRNKYDVDNEKLIFIYGGNLGKPQGIDFLIDVIDSNKKRDDILFLIVGNGTEYESLKTFLDDKKIKNTKLYDRLPKAQYDDLVKCSDVGLIFLDKHFTIPNFPSRLLGYMDSSLPIIAATDINTDIGEIISNNRFGFWCESGKVEDFNHLIKYCCNNKSELKVMGKKAKEYLIENYSAKESANIILKHFE